MFCKFIWAGTFLIYAKITKQPVMFQQVVKEIHKNNLADKLNRLVI